MATSQPDLNVLFVLLGVWRVDFNLLSPSELVEEVRRFWLRFIQRSLHIVVELFCEWIAVVYMEYSVIEVNVDPYIQISPCVVIGQLTNNSRDFLPF